MRDEEEAQVAKYRESTETGPAAVDVFPPSSGLSVLAPVAHCLVAQTFSFLMRVLLLAHSFLAS
jgi:hypothetical protein